jgi:hypothetical protein
MICTPVRHGLPPIKYCSCVPDDERIGLGFAPTVDTQYLKMAELSPSQRTASTARFLLGTGSLVALEAMWQGSVARTLIASAVLAMGGTLLFFAKRAD